jgi:hypothetical protein
MAEHDFTAIHAAIKTLYAMKRPACKTEPTKWGGGNVVLSVPVVDRETHNGKQVSRERNPHVAVVPINCDDCGRTELFNVGHLDRAEPLQPDDTCVERARMFRPSIPLTYERERPSAGCRLAWESERSVRRRFGCCWSSNASVSELTTDALAVVGMRSSARRHEAVSPHRLAVNRRGDPIFARRGPRAPRCGDPGSGGSNALLVAGDAYSLSRGSAGGGRW